MKLKYTFEKVVVDDEIIGIPVGDNANNIFGILKLNPCSSAILTLLEKETSIERIIDILASQYENGRDELEGFVVDVVEQLRTLGFLEE